MRLQEHLRPSRLGGLGGVAVLFTGLEMRGDGKQEVRRGAAMLGIGQHLAEAHGPDLGAGLPVLGTIEAEFRCHCMPSDFEYVFASKRCLGIVINSHHANANKSGIQI